MEKEQVTVKFLQAYKTRIAGKDVSFRSGDIVKIDVDTARELFREKIVLPARQHGQPVANKWRDRC